MEIRLAQPGDVERVMSFYRSVWRKDHPMGIFRELMQYQHLVNGQFRYVIAEENGQIQAAMGYIQYNETETPDISSTMVCSRPDTDGLLSMEMADFLEVATHCENHCGIGFQPDVGGLLIRARGCEIVRLRHYYRLRDQNVYRIAKIRTKKRIPPESLDQLGKETDFVEINTPSQLRDALDEDWLATRVLYKDYSYLLHRYLQHPVYFYYLWKWNGGILVGRVQEYGEAKVLRLVDWIGTDRDLTGIGLALDSVMDRLGAEYCDMYCYGVSHDAMQAGGFTERTLEDETIIPNYFEPFEQKNIELYLSLGQKNKERLRIFKGDSDQDRPNFVYRLEELPSCDQLLYWRGKGYIPADRILDVTVPLSKRNAMPDRMIRMPVRYSEIPLDEILKISEECFVNDTRFAVTLPVDQTIYRQRLLRYAAQEEKGFLCEYGGEIIGFLLPKIIDKTTVEVYLAAIEPEHRSSGAALSLYAFAATYYKDLGFRRMTGRVSSRNIDVMNLYMALGGKFSGAKDIYLKGE